MLDYEIVVVQRYALNLLIQADFVFISAGLQADPLVKLPRAWRGIGVRNKSNDLGTHSCWHCLITQRKHNQTSPNRIFRFTCVLIRLDNPELIRIAWFIGRSAKQQKINVCDLRSDFVCYTRYNRTSSKEYQWWLSYSSLRSGVEVDTWQNDVFLVRITRTSICFVTTVRILSVAYA